MIQIYVVSNHAYTTNSETKNVPVTPPLFPLIVATTPMYINKYTMERMVNARFMWSLESQRLLSDVVLFAWVGGCGKLFFPTVCVCTLFFFFSLHNLLLRRVVPQMWLRTMRHRNVHINLPPSELVSNDMTDGGRDITDSSRCTRDNMFPDA